MSFDQALNFLKEKRPSVDINPGFAEQLKAHERQKAHRSVPPKFSLSLKILT